MPVLQLRSHEYLRSFTQALASAKHETNSDAGVSSSYAISNHGESTNLRETLALRSHPGDSTSTGEGKASFGDREVQDEKSEQDQSALGEDGRPSGDKSMSGGHENGTANGTDKTGTKDERQVMKEYSAEARLYRAYYDEVTWTHRPSTLKTRY